VPDDFVARLLDLHRFLRAGGASVTSGAVKQLTGRDPIDFDRFAREHAGAWKKG
jgi:hypothetical protein